MNFSELKTQFCKMYGGDMQDIRIFMAPGRVNLIGEHTDYNGGFVLPVALNMGASVALRVRKDNKIRLAATDLPDRVEADIAKLDGYRSLKWGNYQLGTAYMLARAGYNIIGCDMLFDETVPHGAGLSSSAAIEIATALAFATLSNEAQGIKDKIDMIGLAKLSQKTEIEYCGVNCGIMDQFASAMGKKGHAIYLNCKDLSHKYVPLNLKGCKIIVANTNKKRALSESKYNERRNQCENALAVLKKYIKNAKFLGDITPCQFEEYKQKIKDKLMRNRAQHVIYENDRVKRSVDTLSRGDIAGFGTLMNESHDSLRNLYEVTGPELDALVQEALDQNAIGSRMTGAGFGGCTVSIVADESIINFIEAVGKGYEKRTGLKADFYVIEAADGGREII